MIEITAYITKLENWTKELAATQAEDALRSTLDYKALVQFRVQTQGTNADNAKFEDYTPVYAQKGRIEKGYQAGFVDFTRTGELWRDIKPDIKAESFGKVTVELGPKRQDNIDKAAGQVKKRGNILLATQDEIQTIAEAYRDYRFSRLES